MWSERRVEESKRRGEAFIFMPHLLRLMWLSIIRSHNSNSFKRADWTIRLRSRLTKGNMAWLIEYARDLDYHFNRELYSLILSWCYFTNLLYFSLSKGGALLQLCVAESGWEWMTRLWLLRHLSPKYKHWAVVFASGFTVIGIHFMIKALFI